jgi:hypothetical protein
MRLVALAAYAALGVGCSFLTSVDELSAGGPRDAGTDATVPDAGADAADDVSRAADVSTPQDAGADAPVADGTAPDSGSDPARVACGAGTCTVGDNLTFCCDYGDSGPESICMTDEGKCPVIEIFCDEQADCDAGHPCCLARDNAGDFASAFCYAQCMNPPNHIGVPLCKTDQECPTGEKCLPALCRDRLYHTCGGVLPPEGCTTN